MGSTMSKYRVHEVAKDFGIPTKEVTEILTKYATTPKNHMQVLDDHELSLIFESLTQKHPVSGIQAIFADTAPAQPKAAPQQEAKKEAAPAAPRNNNNNTGREQQKPAQQGNRQMQQGKKPVSPASPVLPRTSCPLTFIPRPTPSAGEYRLRSSCGSHTASCPQHLLLSAVPPEMFRQLLRP